MTTPSTPPEPSMPPPPPEDGPRYAPPSPPYGYAPYPYQRVPETNSMAIVALIMIFVFPPLAIIFGFIAKSQIDRTGEQGRGFAIAGIAAGIAMTALFVVVIVVYVVLFATLFRDFGQHAVFN